MQRILGFLDLSFLLLGGPGPKYDCIFVGSTTVGLLARKNKKDTHILDVRSLRICLRHQKKRHPAILRDETVHVIPIDLHPTPAVETGGPNRWLSVYASVRCLLLLGL